MKQIISYIHQLPQNILGFLLAKITKASRISSVYKDIDIPFYVANRFNKNWSGVSLGNYIVFSDYRQAVDNSVKHEHGHQKQSLYLGWLYLLVIGLPSFLGNIYDRITHRKWTVQRRIKWYYRQPWEHSADKLGGVERI